MEKIAKMEPEKVTKLYHEESQKENSPHIFGFWVYILSDCLLFASFFATYGVLEWNTFGGPGPAQLLGLSNALLETLILLSSSFTCGIAMLYIHRKQKEQALLWFAATVILGLLFLFFEVHEFVGLAQSGNSFTRSGFLSGFFGLVSLHGCHVTVGLIWMITMMIQLPKRMGNTAFTQKLLTLSYFWHFLDIVWVFIFTFVYLMPFLH